MCDSIKSSLVSSLSPPDKTKTASSQRHVPSSSTTTSGLGAEMKSPEAPVYAVPSEVGVTQTTTTDSGVVARERIPSWKKETAEKTTSSAKTVSDKAMQTMLE